MEDTVEDLQKQSPTLNMDDLSSEINKNSLISTD